MTGPAEQRAAWAAAVGGAGAVDLGAREDPIATLEELARRARASHHGSTAATWTEGYDTDAGPALDTAAAAGVRLVVAVPPAAGPPLAARLGGVAVPQWASVIGEAPDEAAICHLVCVNVTVPPTRTAALERAVTALRATNARLARAHAARP